MTQIAELAREIAENTAVVNGYLEEHGLESPSFDANGPVDFDIRDPDVEKARIKAVEASLTLHDLLQGPRQHLRPYLNGMPLQAIYRYKIASHVPLDNTPISYTDLSALVSLPAPQLRQIIRYSITFHHVFDEPVPGHVTHSAASRLLATSASAYDAIGFQFDETWLAFARTLDAKQKWADSLEPTHTGFSLAMDTELGMYGYYEKHPEIARRFASTMGLASGGRKGFEESLLAKRVDWNGLGAASVVDVGGSKGHISVGLARLAPGLTFVVQDLAEALQGAEDALPAEVQERLVFEVYDFFTEQTVKGADVYLFSHILHNWSDEHVLRILAKLIPALKKGARVVISDAILPEPKTLGLLKERDLRATDMAMWSLYNAREREQEDWKMILKTADERFGDIKFHTGSSAWGVIETTWMGS